MRSWRKAFRGRGNEFGWGGRREGCSLKGPCDVVRCGQGLCVCQESGRIGVPRTSTAPGWDEGNHPERRTSTKRVVLGGKMVEIMET